MRDRCIVESPTDVYSASPAVAGPWQLLKSEYYKLQTSSAERIVQLDTQNAHLCERLRAYEKLEEELDRAVIQAHHSSHRKAGRCSLW